MINDLNRSLRDQFDFEYKYRAAAINGFRTMLFHPEAVTS